MSLTRARVAALRVRIRILEGKLSELRALASSGHRRDAIAKGEEALVRIGQSLLQESFSIQTQENLVLALEQQVEILRKSND